MKNRQIGKRLLCVFFCIASLFVFCIPASAEENPIPSMQEASAVYFYHIESDQIVGTKNETMQVSAGSSVKIMAGLIACERLAGHLQEEVMVTKSMVSGVVGHRLNLKSGDYLTVEHLLYSAVCSSYNDAFYVLAHTVSGSTEAFVELMNQRARELGLENTFFTDPSGIDDGSVTTANDVAKLALKAYENPLYLQMCGTERCAVKVSGESRTIYNRNAMIFSRDTTKYYNSSCIGMSAGSTTKGGHCVVSLTRKNNETYLCVVLGATETTDTEYGYVVANRLSDWAFRSYAYRAPRYGLGPDERGQGLHQGIALSVSAQGRGGGDRIQYSFDVFRAGGARGGRYPRGIRGGVLSRESAWHPAPLHHGGSREKLDRQQSQGDQVADHKPSRAGGIDLFCSRHRGMGHS